MVLWIYRRCCCRGLNSSSEKMTSARMALGAIRPCKASVCKASLLSRWALYSWQICLIYTWQYTFRTVKSQ